MPRSPRDRKPGRPTGRPKTTAGRSRSQPRAAAAPPEPATGSSERSADAAARPAPARPARKRSTASRGRRAVAGKGGSQRVVPIELEASSSLEATLARLRDELGHWVKKGRHLKVRFKLRGRPILPDIPLGALVAVEAASFWWAGLLRVLLVNLGARTVLDVEIVSEAEQEVSRGKAALLEGDLDRAREAFENALSMDRDCASAHLNLAVALKLRGKIAAARESLERAERLDPQGPTGEEARRLLDSLPR